MPDWTYHTLFQRVLFRLGPHRGRGTAMGALGRLSRLPLGKSVIRMMGHAAPDDRLALERCGISFPTPVALGCRFDPSSQAIGGLQEFGFGMIEVGPVVGSEPETAGKITLEPVNESIHCAAPLESISADQLAVRLRASIPELISESQRQPIFARLEPVNAAEAKRMLDTLRPWVSGVILDLSRLTFAQEIAPDSDLPIVVSITPEQLEAAECREALHAALTRDDVIGVMLCESDSTTDSITLGADAFDRHINATSQLRAETGSEALLISGAAVHSPDDGARLLRAGADLVTVDSGLVFSGPGLPKRINELVLHDKLEAITASGKKAVRAGEQAWLWEFLMGLAMFIGGVMALVIASTRVVMPYDETQAGMTRDQIANINDNLLPFMAHDRVTLAGTMLALGVLYMTFAWHGTRNGLHWAFVAITASGFAGFFGFFFFLGFGYFDPFHAFVTAILFQFILLSVHSGIPKRQRISVPDRHNDSAWKRSQWGQLIFIAHGIAMLVAGVTISIVGMTAVFVQDDLDFMNITREELCAADPLLIPLIAHDRATFGAMLISTGILTFLAALWGFRRGEAWLWWSLLISGCVAYVATIAVHLVVGYDSFRHLIPAWGGLLAIFVASGLSSGYLRDRSSPKYAATTEVR